MCLRFAKRSVSLVGILLCSLLTSLSSASDEPREPRFVLSRNGYDAVLLRGTEVGMEQLATLESGHVAYGSHDGYLCLVRLHPRVREMAIRGEWPTHTTVVSLYKKQNFALIAEYELPVASLNQHGLYEERVVLFSDTLTAYFINGFPKISFDDSGKKRCGRSLVKVDMRTGEYSEFCLPKSYRDPRVIQVSRSVGVFQSGNPILTIIEPDLLASSEIILGDAERNRVYFDNPRPDSSRINVELSSRLVGRASGLLYVPPDRFLYADGALAAHRIGDRWQPASVIVSLTKLTADFQLLSVDPLENTNKVAFSRLNNEGYIEKVVIWDIVNGTILNEFSVKERSFGLVCFAKDEEFSVLNDSGRSLDNYRMSDGTMLGTHSFEVESFSHFAKIIPR